jgi:hypothetical protein
MRCVLPLAAAALTALASTAEGQATMSTLVHVPGTTIEIVGLERWTPAMIQDSMDVHAPGTSLSTHACAAVLRYQLGFANAAAMILRQRDGTRYVFLPVIEPQDSALVHHRILPRDTTASTAPWTPLVQWARTEGSLLDRVVAARIRARGARPTWRVGEGVSRADSTRVREISTYLDAHAAPRDAAAARRILERSPYLFDRVAAVAILSSFDRDDATWRALVGALLESDGVVPGTASQVLAAFAHEVPRRVDWRPAAAELHALLNGGSLFYLHTVLGALVATGVDSTLARPLLRGGGHAVLMYAGAAHPAFRTAAHRFLHAVSGKEQESDVAAWRAWVAGL